MYKLSDVARVLGGIVLKDGGFETLEFCTSDCEVPFLTFLENAKYANQISRNAVCVVTTMNSKDCISSNVQGILITDEPKSWFYRCHNFLADNDAGYARLDRETTIGQNCHISPLACIAPKNVIIGDNVSIAAFVVVRENVQIGNNVTIHENCVIGGKSFNFVKTNQGEMISLTDLGRVIIEDDVEIFPLCHIAGAPLPTDVTHLKKGCRVDALVHIGHGTSIGERTEIPAGAQIAGNCRIGKDAWIGVNATVANRIKIGDNGRVSLGAVVTKNVEENQTVSGNFAVDHSRFISELREANNRANIKIQ